MQNNEVEYAGFWVRAAAMLIDTLLIMVITMPLLVMIYGWAYFDSTDIYQGPADILISWVFPMIAVIAYWAYKQATPGKMAFSARIVDAKTGRPASTGQLVGRYFAYIISALPFCLGYIWAGWDKRKQAWHDKLAGTVVIKSVKSGPEPVKFDEVGGGHD